MRSKKDFRKWDKRCKNSRPHCTADLAEVSTWKHEVFDHHKRRIARWFQRNFTNKPSQVDCDRQFLPSIAFCCWVPQHYYQHRRVSTVTTPKNNGLASNSDSGLMNWKDGLTGIRRHWLFRSIKRQWMLHSFLLRRWWKIRCRRWISGRMAKRTFRNDILLQQGRLALDSFLLSSFNSA